ncbi:hypothetical protein VTN77DRAFT_2507 [Rasamsonia byssochlamydoides]|uniref:uncharacterized protein n=1 Tax=Rasamsonia byssochlamydoides TaxID=89139 RepID=UPI003743380E
MASHVTNPDPSLSSTSSSSLSSPNWKKPKRIDDVTLRNQDIFDPWNSASTGHQRAENPYSRTTKWRQTRTQKLARQFQGLPNECAGANNGNSRGRTGEWRWLSAEETKRKEFGCADIRKYLGGLKKQQMDSVSISEKKPFPSTSSSSTTQTASEEDGKQPAEYNPPFARQQLDNSDNDNDNDNDNNKNASDDNTLSQNEEKKNETGRAPARGIFSGLTFYINGSTSPVISDHKLKQLLAENGANISIALGRRTVTHVILGKPNNGNCSGAGGGLAAGKLQKEIARVGGKGVKFVGVEWVLESLKASRRLPEARFATLHMASKSQPSVYNMFSSAAAAGK